MRYFILKFPLHSETTRDRRHNFCDFGCRLISRLRDMGQQRCYIPQIASLWERKELAIVRVFTERVLNNVEIARNRASRVKRGQGGGCRAHGLWLDFPPAIRYNETLISSKRYQNPRRI